jgi:predicted MFS family arabinose efflux permease
MVAPEDPLSEVPSSTEQVTTTGPVLNARAIAVLAAASATSVANGYYIQPLLVVIATTFGVPEQYVGVLPAMTQFGLACGVVFLLPLGDVVSVRTLLMVVIPLQIAALTLLFASHLVSSLGIACLLVGLFGITPYVLPPYASLHVPPERIGHVTGVLTRGIIIGILLARVIAGIVGTHLGWRAVYFLAAVAMVFVFFALRRFVHATPHASKREFPGYRALIVSMVRLVVAVPELRIAALCQAVTFGSFNAFWLGASLYLQSPTFGWSPGAVGLVAVIGVIAASSAPLFGRTADRVGPRVTRFIALIGMCVAWVIFFVFRQQLFAMAIGVVLLDIGAALLDISNRTILYGLKSEIRSRLNAIYTVAMLGGGAIMSALAGLCWSAGGWPAICALGFLPIVLSMVVVGRSDVARTRSSDRD